MAQKHMSKVVPIGYSETKMGRGIAIFFLIFVVAVSVILVNSGMGIKYAVYLFAGAAVFSVLFIIADLSSNKKHRERITHMEKMLKCPYVTGSVIEVKKYYRGLNGKIKEIKPGLYIKAKDCAYTIRASFIDADNNEILVESKPYALNPERMLESNKVRIYYSTANEFWIDINEL